MDDWSIEAFLQLLTCLSSFLSCTPSSSSNNLFGMYLLYLKVDVREQVLLAANGLLTSCGTKLHPNLWQSLFDLLAAAAHGKSSDVASGVSSSSTSGSASSSSKDLPTDSAEAGPATTSGRSRSSDESPSLTETESAELSTLVSKGGSLTPLETHRVRHLMAKSTPGSRNPNALPSVKGASVGGGGFKSAEEEMAWLMEKSKGVALSATEQARVSEAIILLLGLAFFSYFRSIHEARTADCCGCFVYRLLPLAHLLCFCLLSAPFHCVARCLYMWAGARAHVTCYREGRRSGGGAHRDEPPSGRPSASIMGRRLRGAGVSVPQTHCRRLP